MRPFAFVAFFASGFAGLVFELVWMRALGLAMGSTTVAIATTTAAYMGGLAVGAYIGGHYSERCRSPLLLYGVVELAIGVVGLAVPWMASQMGGAEAAWALQSAYGRGLLRFVLGCMILGVPTTAMGMTLPLLAQWLQPARHRVAHDVGLLYGLNLAGATCGAYMAGFFFLPRLGHHDTNLVAALIDMILGATALVFALWLLRKNYHTKSLIGQASPEEGATCTPGDIHNAANSDAPEASASIFLQHQRYIVFLLAATGALSMGLQVLWTRAIGTALGPSSYAFSVILTVYLLGLGIGGALSARLSPRVLRPRLVLALALLLTGAAAYFGVAVVDELPLILRRFVLDEDMTPAGLFRAEFAIAGLALLPATISMGTLFPLTIRAVVGSRIGMAVGRAVAINTLGAIMGSAAAVFVLLPVWGVEVGLLVLSGAYLFLALIMAMSAEEPERGDWKYDARRPLAIAAAVAIVLVSILPRWNVSQWTLGMFRVSSTRDFYPEDVENVLTDDDTIIFHKDGLASTVTVEAEDGERWIKVDGKIDGSSEGDMPTQVLSGMLPLLMKPQSRNVLVIGCGTCVTIGVILKAAAGIERATLVELEPAVLEAARLFSDVNYAPWDDPRLLIIEDDGRNFLHNMSFESENTDTDNRFDLIVSEPSNPWMTGAASLFTQEFFQLAHSRLQPTGAFVQWVQLYEMAPERIHSILKTFSSVFPHVLLFSAHRNSNDLLMVGSPTEIHLDWPELQQSFMRWKEFLTVAELKKPEELLGLAMIGDAALKTLSATINTDDNAYVEFGAPLDLVTFAEIDPEVEILGSMNGKRFALMQEYFSGVQPSAYADIAYGLLRQGRLLDAKEFAARVGPDVPHRGKATQVGRLAELLLEEDKQSVVKAGLMEQDPRYASIVRLVLAQKDDEALELLKQDHEKSRTAAYDLLHGYLLYRAGYYNEGDTQLRRALRQVHANEANSALEPAVRYYQAKRAFEAGEFTHAAAYMNAYTQLVNPLSASAKPE